MPARNSKTKKASSSPSKKTSSVKKSRTNKKPKPTSKLYRILNRDEDWSGDQSPLKITFEIKKTNNTAIITRCKEFREMVYKDTINLFHDNKDLLLKYKNKTDKIIKLN